MTGWLHSLSATEFLAVALGAGVAAVPLIGVAAGAILLGLLALIDEDPK